MSGKDDEKGTEIRQSRFPLSLFWSIFGLIALMGGIHQGILVLMDSLQLNGLWQTHIALAYLLLVAAGLTLYVRRMTRKTYELPLQRISKATKQVAEGDFSVYIPAMHTADKLDYLDVMIMDLNKMIEELGSIETLKTDFFSNVSHEIKTPLAVIQNSAELLQAGELTERQRESVDTIYWQSRRLADMITNILKLNKLEKQVITPAAEPYDLCGQLADCALLFEELWEKKNLDFSARLEDRAMILADESLMEIVWNNLLSNAVKFTEEGGAITLTQTSDKERITVSVSDTGCGMSEETIRHIFEKFYQGDTSHATEGNGLGLALTFRILQLSGYTIAVESTLGEGTTFTVTIPLGQTDDGKGTGENDIYCV